MTMWWTQHCYVILYYTIINRLTDHLLSETPWNTICCQVETGSTKENHRRVSAERSTWCMLCFSWTFMYYFGQHERLRLNPNSLIGTSPYPSPLVLTLGTAPSNGIARGSGWKIPQWNERTPRDLILHRQSSMLLQTVEFPKEFTMPSAAGTVSVAWAFFCGYQPHYRNGIKRSIEWLNLYICVLLLSHCCTSLLCLPPFCWWFEQNCGKFLIPFICNVILKNLPFQSQTALLFNPSPLNSLSWDRSTSSCENAKWSVKRVRPRN